MSFQNIGKIEDVDFYLDLAFSRAKKKGVELRTDQIKGTRIEKSQRIEIAKIREISIVLTRHMGLIVRSFPSLDDMPEFYKEMIKLFTDYVKLKKALGSVNWVKKKIVDFTREYESKMKSTSDLEMVNKHRRDYYGRISSLLKQIKKELKVLDDTRKVLKEFPQIKTKLFTIALVGFPNVGKTTLLSKMSQSTPEINNYAFTTKGVNVGYMKTGQERIQVLDTPGTLNRFQKMNKIEKQAHLAVKYCADLLIYVFDPTESYPMSEQEELLKVFEKFELPTLLFISKQDMDIDQKLVEKLKKKYKILGLEELKKEIVKKSK